MQACVRTRPERRRPARIGRLCTVHAYRWGDPERHSYLVGIFAHPQRALQAAQAEEAERGGKYACEVRAWRAPCGPSGSRNSVVLKALPGLRAGIAPLPADDRPVAALVRAAVLAERERCARLLELAPQQLRLLAGELSAQEMRTTQAVLRNRAWLLRQEPGTVD